MSFVIRSLPTKSSQLKNKNASALISFFNSDSAVLYLYGNTGTGKTFAVNMLVKEYGYEIIYLVPPFDEEFVLNASSYSLLFGDKKLVVVDVGDSLSAKDLAVLAKGRWDETRLIIIGDTYPRTSPIRNAFKDKPYRFEAIKFHEFEDMVILSCLTIYAAELGAKVSYETLVEIAERAAGDMRAARQSLRALVASGRESELKCFLPLSDDEYFNNINKLFSGNDEDAEEAASYFGDYLTLQLIRKNIVAKLPKESTLMSILKQLSGLDADFGDFLVYLSSVVGRKSKSKRFVSYKKAKAFAVPSINVKCSNAKKILYLRGYEKWINLKK